MVEVSTLLIVPQTEKCNANCKFCITHNIYDMTPGIGPIKEQERDYCKLESVLKFAKGIGVVDCNITGGTEPTLIGGYMLGSIIQQASKYFGRINLYTNGAKLVEPKNSPVNSMLEDLDRRGLTNLTISRAHYDDEKNSQIMRMHEYDLEKVIEIALKRNLDIKLSCILAEEGIGSDKEIIAYLNKAKQLGVGKVIFRELLSIPGESDYGKWSRDNYIPVTKVAGIMQKSKAEEFRGLWNQKIWDYNGIAVTIWPDGSRKDTINNGDLIYMPDNHLYSSWMYKSSRIM